MIRFSQSEHIKKMVETIRRPTRPGNSHNAFLNQLGREMKFDIQNKICTQGNFIIITALL
jgi:hypothetical protein